ncbi:LMBR1-like conserved region-containing protein [Heterostelium album PN500]|uniref:LMBR1-like conserved region-containing protein n=1 Tax=Heterostelium pallidum (strain ATCC 26659 / Pp 5 / PN500) TaxID=670386 RepID=D3AWV5_HETP5|nr:LMBR1-like conserved region-containing protein [Heterostelium album PN500]EFA86778.1 LMBR1-like conserved region-containing protein [Heterostelium album PN500]|eukprot:XP_020438882.1 LMBR1-like conserved region-containing protein [Heterostelium album PN500]
MLDIGFGWASFGGVVIVFCYIIKILLSLKYWSDKHESERLTTFVTVTGLTLTLMCVMLIPVDILNVSTMSNSSVMYACILAFALIIIPFTYFYYEEDDYDVSTGARVLGGCKYTAFLIVFTVVLLVVGAFIRPGSSKPVDNQNIKDWIEQELANQNAAEGSLMFAIACLTLLGFVVWICYTAYGFSAFPIGLIKGKRRVSDDRREINDDLHKTREKANYFRSKYASGKTMSADEEATMNLLKSKERVLSKHSARLESSNSGIKKILVIFRPFAFIFGFFFLLVSILIIISIVLSIIDKLSSSVCGAACGFLTDYPNLKNPIDLMLSSTAPYFPLDYILLGLIIVYIYAVTISGIVRIGIRFLWIKMYEFAPSKTVPQGLLIASILLMLSNLCLNIQIIQLAPRYSLFGTQVWYNATSNTVQPCSIDAPTDLCVMSQIGLLTSRIEMGTSFFGIVYYYATWGIVGAFLIGTLVSIFKRRDSNLQSFNNDSDEEI